MKKVYLIANWKMNPTTTQQAENLAGDISVGMESVSTKNIEVVLCPPPVYLPVIKPKMSGVALGAQNCHFKDSGAYTGEVSPTMLEDVGCNYIIIGHSERRAYFGEDGEFINKKIKAALQHSMTPILAVGEKDSESLNIVVDQLKEALKGISKKDMKKIIVAYEPIWAIGTGEPATPDQALSAKILIRKTIGKLYSQAVSESVPVIYGGSTDSKNIRSFIAEGEMNGALVGGSSLKAKEFVRIAVAVNK